MAITQARKTRLENRITKKELYLTSLYTLQENFDDVLNYKFDSGEGSQSTVFRSVSEVSRTIRQIESQIDRLNRELLGHSIVNVNLRRN